MNIYLLKLSRWPFLKKVIKPIDQFRTLLFGHQTYTRLKLALHISESRKENLWHPGQYFRDIDIEKLKICFIQVLLWHMGSAKLRFCEFIASPKMTSYDKSGTFRENTISMYKNI